MNLELSNEQERQILASIRSGGYAHVAAAAWGVAPWAWNQWRRLGRGKEGAEPYRALYLKVEQAQAQARLKAEMAVMDADPRTWLKHGPGKNRPGSPGWSALPRAALPRRRAGDFLADPAVAEFLDKVRSVLEAYPEALARLSEATADFGGDAGSTRGSEVPIVPETPPEREGGEGNVPRDCRDGD